MKKYIFFYLFLIYYNSYSQTLQEVLNQVNKNTSDARPLQFESNYNLFKNENDKKPHESYKGFYVKNAKNDCYLKIGENEFFNNEKICLRVIPKDKMVIIASPNIFIAKEFELKTLLEEFSIKSFTIKNETWELTLNAKPLSGSDYSKIIIQIGKDYFIKKQSLFYKNGINFSKKYNKQEISYPVLTVDFINYSRIIKEPNVLSIDKYLIFSNNKYLSKIKNYKLVDDRQAQLKKTKN